MSEERKFVLMVCFKIVLTIYFAFAVWCCSEANSKSDWAQVGTPFAYGMALLLAIGYRIRNS